MREPVSGSNAAETINSGLVDLSGVSFTEVVDADGTTLDDTILGYALRRILDGSEDPVAAFASTLVAYVD